MTVMKEDDDQNENDDLTGQDENKGKKLTDWSNLSKQIIALSIWLMYSLVLVNQLSCNLETYTFQLVHYNFS